MSLMLGGDFRIVDFAAWHECLQHGLDLVLWAFKTGMGKR